VRIDKTRIIIPNVFTPDNADGKNDAFDIDILGFTLYNLNIYNRWGALVFSGTKDGLDNDGVNWNGKTFNDGEQCPAGVYYFIFTYKLITDLIETTVHGTVTLIRDK
jgi:gliding motility-associated-like protein